MEIRITDNRVDLSSSSSDVIPKSRPICFDNNKIYLDTGYYLNLPLKIIIESSSVAKLSEKSYSKKLLKDIVECVDERKKQLVISGAIISLETRKEKEHFYTYINLDSGYFIYMNYNEADLRNIIEAVNNEEKS